MILQTKASTLAVLMATEGGKCPHLNALRDAIELARAEDISNDRTNLKFQENKDN